MLVTNQCQGCGQWRSKNHICPTRPTSDGAARFTRVPPPADQARHTPDPTAQLPALPAELVSPIPRVERARAYLTSLYDDRKRDAIKGTGPTAFLPSAPASTPPAVFTEREVAVVTAMSRDCDMNPDTPWTGPERAHLEDLLTPVDAFEGTATPHTVDHGGRAYILDRADTDPVLRDRLRLAFTVTPRPSRRDPADRHTAPIPASMLIIALHDAASTDTRFAEARDWAVAYTAAHHLGSVTERVEELMATVMNDAGQQSPDVAARISAYFQPRMPAIA